MFLNDCGANGDEHMLQRLVVPGDDIQEQLEPYAKTLEPLGISKEQLMEYVIEIAATQDVRTCMARIRRDVSFWHMANAPQSPETVEKIVYTCYDAVDTLLKPVTAKLRHVFGGVPESLMLKEFMGADPVFSILVDDSNENKPDHPHRCMEG